MAAPFGLPTKFIEQVELITNDPRDKVPSGRLCRLNEKGEYVEVEPVAGEMHGEIRQVDFSKMVQVDQAKAETAGRRWAEEHERRILAAMNRDGEYFSLQPDGTGHIEPERVSTEADADEPIVLKADA